MQETLNNAKIEFEKKFEEKAKSEKKVFSFGTAIATPSIEATEIFQSKKDADIKKPDNDELTITLMNKQYTGRFIRADVVSLDISAYIYETSDNTRFTVDVNGRIMEVLFPENFTYPVNFANPEKLLSKEEYIKSATEHLINILGEKEASRYEACNVSMNTNVIKVYFEANDIENGNFKLLDQIKIRLDDKGNILGFRGDYVGLYNNKVIPKDLSDNDVKKMIRESLVKSDVQIELSDNKTLVILSDGRMACNISFRLIEGDEAGGWERALIPLE